MISEIIRRAFPNLSPTFVFVWFVDRLLNLEKNLRGLCALAPFRETRLTQPGFSRRRKGAKVLPEARIGLRARLADL